MQVSLECKGKISAPANTRQDDNTHSHKDDKSRRCVRVDHAGPLQNVADKGVGNGGQCANEQKFREVFHRVISG